MRKANYDKFPSTKLAGMLVQGWDSYHFCVKKENGCKKSAGCGFIYWSI